MQGGEQPKKNENVKIEFQFFYMVNSITSIYIINMVTMNILFD